MKKTLIIIGLCIGLSVSSQGTVSAESSTFTVDVYLSSGGENLNAFGGTLSHPKTWTVEEIIIPSSKLLYWIEAPTVKNFGELPFSGIFPGGLNRLENTVQSHILFSVEFVGDRLEEGLSFESPQFFLNHPTALAATNSVFKYTLDSSSFFKNFQTASIFSGINYSFEKDPVTQNETLVLDTYRGDLASYNFFAKEGDFGSGAWKGVDGVKELNSTTQTVLLDVRSPQGDEYELVLRRSFLDRFVWFLGWGGGGVFFLYLFYLVYKIFTLRPEELTRR